MPLVRVKKAAEYTGLHPNTIRKYIDQGVVKGVRIGRHRYVDTSELDRLMGRSHNSNGVAIYARVSTRKQEENLKRQTGRLVQYCTNQGLPVVAIITEIASGVNENRAGLKKVIRLAREGKISAVVVEYKDRLARIGYGYIKDWLNSMGVEVIVVNPGGDKEEMEELVEDLIAIVSSFSARIYGRRGSREVVNRLKEALDEAR